MSTPSLPSRHRPWWRRGGAGTGLLTVLAALAAFFTLTGWSDLVADPNGFLDPVGRITMVYVALSLALRATALPRWALLLVQAYALWVLLGVDSLGLGLREALLPLPVTVGDHVEAIGDGVAAAQRYPSPVPASVGAIQPLLIVGGAGVVVLVDLLAVTLRRVPLSGLPLLAAFTVPVAILDGFPWLTFAVVGTFFVLLLAADHLSRLSQWGRTFVARRSDDEPGALGAGEALQRNGPLTLQIGAIALVAAVLAPLAVPSYDGLFGGGGPGEGGKGRTVSLENPIANMQRDLDRGRDTDVLFLTTDDPDPRYIRVTALDRFDRDSWRPGRRQLPPDQKVAGALPPPVGFGPAYRATSHVYRFRTTGDLQSTWLPLPFPTRSATVPGDWRYDLAARDVRSGSEGVNAADLSYEATGDVVDPIARQLVEARTPPASIARTGTELPWDTTPSWLEDVVDGITRGTDSDFAAAVAMQRWFRSGGHFRYSLDNADGSGLEALRRFLTVDRVGYCEQFATAMALMARVHGIPARVAVGFLGPEPLGRDQFVFSTHDLHAWPELYFEGVGWVRFEPTPADRDEAVAPPYTRGRVPQLRPADQSTAPSAAPSATPTRRPRQDTTASTDATNAGGGPSPWWPVGVVAVLALLLAPRGLRQTARRRRAAGDDGGSLVEGAWAELRATALDLGLGWDDRVTVRRRAAGLAQVLRRGPVAGRRTSADDVVSEAAARESLDALVVAVERTRFYAVPPTTEEGREALVAAEVVGRALAQRVGERTRLRATWLPRSVTAPGRPAPVSATAQARAAAARSGEDRDSVSL
jgi:transglutaminase-like putative cysteine protease